MPNDVPAAPPVVIATADTLLSANSEDTEEL